MNIPSFQEDLISQLLPAIKLLQNLGYEYLSPDEAVRAQAAAIVRN